MVADMQIILNIDFLINHGLPIAWFVQSLFLLKRINKKPKQRLLSKPEAQSSIK